jgi:hypothetical protein
MTIHDHSTLPTAEPVTQWTPPAGPPSGPAGSGAPGPKKNPKVAIAGALVAVAVASAGVTAGVMAATGGSSTSSTAGGPGGSGSGGFGGAGGPGGTGGGAGAGMSALHGTYTVSDGNGSYTTELTQTGTVSAVSAGSITVKSVDGYSKTYTITTSTSVDNGSDKISAVVTGHTVRIVASSKAVATAITDTNLSSTQNGNAQGGTGTGTNQGGTGTGTNQGGTGTGTNQGGPGGGAAGQ